MQPAFREIFLHPVKHRPEVVAAILETAGCEQLAFGNRGRSFGIGWIVAQRERGAGERMLLVTVRTYP
ncbi:hypothetical protein AK36_2488 [Burkholderia vietnamiensis LMG 10929]|nr:hypothetical protein AK36_2488 [Burkholderia vietnamiensis LMG 10929]KVM50563.1 hypothetical protein WJ57_16530 [Burkholderia vietnamiensis]KVS00630.1 hypothetical protein WK30_19625 [Burkholderia vietnamiensis]